MAFSLAPSRPSPLEKVADSISEVLSEDMVCNKIELALQVEPAQLKKGMPHQQDRRA